LAGLPGPVLAKTIALLVGVGQYPQVSDRLDGPAYDIAAMTGVLTQRMGVAPADIRTLVDGAATGAAIRSELKALVGRSNPGDTVILYFSGHGTSGRDSSFAEADLPFGTGAFLPYDWRSNPAQPLRNRLIVGRFDLAPLALKPLDDGNRTVLAFFDTCYSGNAVRGVKPAVRYRYVPMGGSDTFMAAPSPAVATAAPQPYPYRNVIMLAASAETEKAADLAGGPDTSDGKPKGAFTDALLRVFAGKEPADFNGDGKVSFAELNRAQINYMARAGLSQSPQLLPALVDDQSRQIFKAVPGLAAVAPTTGATRLSVALEIGAEGLRAPLDQLGGIAINGSAPQFRVRGSGDRYRLSNAAGDVILDGASADTIVARVRAGQWLAAVEAGAHAGIDLRATTTPETRGGTFVIDRDALKFGVSTSVDATLLLVDVFADGTLATLYPVLPGETGALAARTGLALPAGAPIKAVLPVGLDRVVVLAFASPPVGLDRWRRLNAPFGSETGQAFVAWLATVGPYAANLIDVRVVKAP
jgi:hypothetical protein